MRAQAHVSMAFACISRKGKNMTHERLFFTEKYPDVYLTSYLHEESPELAANKRKAIIVCPGGGYEFRSRREAEPIALQFFAAGLNAFVLEYSICEEAANYAPLIQACLAVKYLRENAERFYLNGDVFVTGFSAGGHLAAWSGTMWHIPQVAEASGGNTELCKPTATIPCYPVISADRSISHAGSVIALNSHVDDDGIFRFSLEDFVDEKTSPAFLWHTADDPVVPVQNSIVYAASLAKYHIPFELHIYPKGPHGLALCNKVTFSQHPDHIAPYAENWIEHAIRWIDETPFRN